MALITFQDLPSTQTPINSTNLNDNFNELDTKTNPQIITAELSSNFTKTINDYEIIPFNRSVLVGTKLSIDNNGIKVGSGVSKVKISSKATFNSLTSGTKWLTIYKNNEASIPNIATFSSRATIYSTETVITVSEDDVIYAKVNGTSGDVIRGGGGYTNITVEVVE